jgi:hypothetical protein
MSNVMQNEIVALWRDGADADHPSGPLFTSGEFAEADIVCETFTGSGKCGTACTFSRTLQCC